MGISGSESFFVSYCFETQNDQEIYLALLSKKIRPNYQAIVNPSITHHFATDFKSKTQQEELKKLNRSFISLHPEFCPY